jgi:hypothetical protein
MGVSRATAQPKVEEPKDGIIQVRVLNRKDETVTHRTYYGTPTSYTRKTLFGVPFILQIPNKITYADLYREALHQLQRFLKVRAVAATPLLLSWCGDSPRLCCRFACSGHARSSACRGADGG